MTSDPRPSETALDILDYYFPNAQFGRGSPDVCAMRIRIAALAASPAPTLAQLKKIEWAADSYAWPCCPACRHREPTHEFDCWLNAAIQSQVQP